MAAYFPSIDGGTKPQRADICVLLIAVNQDAVR